MNNKEYTEAVDKGYYPVDKIVSLPEPFINDKGIIQNLLLFPITSIAVITSKAGSVRSNHYHKTDWHYLYILSGSMKYYEKENRVHCFSCGKSWDSIDVYQKLNNCSFKDAVNKLT